ncbi:MAG: ATP-binding protein [Actinobacteria bacterium]|nr:ATP-binding protein [Actinomycetota bacterium]
MVARVVRGVGNTGWVVSLSDIVDLAASGESETVEFKKTTGQKREAAKTLSAMLNSAGGAVLFGSLMTAALLVKLFRRGLLRT